MVTSHINIIPCLWFDDQAEEAAAYYVGIFSNARINKTTYFTEVGFEHHGKPAGSVLTVEFELDGQPMSALNGGPLFVFNEAISLQVMCDSQEQATGARWAPVATCAHSNAAGSRTSSACRGRSCRNASSNCLTCLIRRPRTE